MPALHVMGGRYKYVSFWGGRMKEEEIGLFGADEGWRKGRFWDDTCFAEMIGKKYISRVWMGCLVER